jgi:hypothetical protein
MSDTSNNSGRSPSTTQKQPLSKVRRKQRKRLFYTNKPDSEELAFAPPEVAEYVSAIHNAMAAPTWGQFKALIPPEEYERLLEKVRDAKPSKTRCPQTMTAHLIRGFGFRSGMMETIPTGFSRNKEGGSRNQ